VGAPSNASSRRVVATAERDALQAEMDALADEFYGDVATAAPYRASATPATTSASTSAGGHTDGVYNKTDVRQGVALPVLRSQTTWYSGPTNPEGRVFDASDSNLLCMDVLVPPSAAGAKSASTSASLCVVGSADHGLKVFNLDSMREVKSLYTKSCGHTDWVTSCRFLSDRRVLSGGMDSKLCLWSDVTRGGPARCVDLLGHTGSISQVEVNERQGRIVAMSASYDRTIRIWELSGAAAGGGRETGCLAGHKGPVTQFSWCETQLLSGDRQGTVKLWDVETAQCHVTASSRRGQIGALGHLSHPDVGHLVMFGDQGGVLTVLDARAPPKAKPVFQEELHPAGMVTFIRAPVASAVAAPLVLTCGADKRIVACDARQNFTAVYTVSDHDDFVYSMEILGNLLLTGAGNGRLLVHNVETGALCYELDANAAAVREIFASPGKLVTSGDDGKAKVFDFM
jgi:WD40 repeat protein